MIFDHEFVACIKEVSEEFVRSASLFGSDLSNGLLQCFILGQTPTLGVWLWWFCLAFGLNAWDLSVALEAAFHLGGCDIGDCCLVV